MNLTIKNVQIDELDVYAKVFVEVFNASGENWSLNSSKTHILENIGEKTSWGAFDGEELVGMLIAKPSAIENNTMLYVDTVAVLPSYQHKGIGKLLWQQLEEYIEDKDIQGIQLLANKEFDSYKWYKDMGFAESGWIELYKIKETKND